MIIRNVNRFYAFQSHALDYKASPKYLPPCPNTYCAPLPATYPGEGLLGSGSCEQLCRHDLSKVSQEELAAHSCYGELKNEQS